MLRSLRARLVLTYAGLTLLTVGGLALFTVSRLEDLLLRRLADDLNAQANLVALQVADNLAAGRLEQIGVTLERVDQATTARALIVNQQAEVVAASEPEGRASLGARRDDPGLHEALAGTRSNLVLPRARGQEVLYAAAPIEADGRIVGAVRLAYELRDLEATLRGLNLTVAAGALGAVLLAAVVSFGFARAIGDPVREVSQAAGALAAGDLSKQLEARSNDEVGELVAAFNAMAGQLREAETARREFATDVSHELHSLAGAMQVAAEALERGATAEPDLRERLIAGLVGHTRRLNRLSEDLLQLARLEEGRLSLSFEACSLAAVARQTVDEFAAEARERGLELRLEAAGEPLIPGDAVRLQQALGNLVENALKYTPRGGRVVVSLDSHAGAYRLAVADNGAGIPPEELPRIWQRYYRVEGRASGGPGGTGLGLAIAAGIVKAHGGQIDVQSAPGQGATFTIQLPRPRASRDSL